MSFFSIRISALIALALGGLTIAGWTSNSSAQVANTNSDLESRVKAYESSCIASLRLINTAQVTYWGGNQKKGFARRLEELGPKGEGLIDQRLANGQKDDYRFVLTSDSVEVENGRGHYTISARPVRRLVKGQRSFFTDETNLIRFTRGNRKATAADSPID
jgi:hypothetical protein